MSIEPLPVPAPLSSEPAFSIVTVCRNAMPQIGRAAASLLEQDYPHWEMVVVDALSTDGTLAHLESLNEPRIRVVSEADAGIYDAMNKGIARATGEILFFLNADDALHDPGALRRVAGAFLAHPGASVVYGDYMQVFGPGQTRLAEQPRQLTTLFFSFTNLVHQTMFIRRSAFTTVGNYDTRFKLCADFYWNMTALCRHGLSFVHLPGPISWFSMTGTHLSPASQATLIKEKAACVAKFVSNRPPQALQPDPGPPIDCWIWHTEQMGLSGIFTWLYHLRQRRDALPGLRLRFLSLELAPPGFDQIPAPVESLYDLRVRTPSEFLEFLVVHGSSLHIINHAFAYVPIVLELLKQQARLVRMIGVCHTDQDFYYVNLAQLDGALRGHIAVSPACRDRLEQLLPGRRGAIQVLPAYTMPVPEPRIAPRDPAEPLRLIYMGRVIQYQKRVFDLADLSRLLKKAGVPATLTVVGGGPDLEELKRLFSDAAAHIPVTFLGILPPWEVEPLLPRHDLFILTSEMEGASVSLVEAMTREVVPVITRTESGSDFVRHQHNGVVVPIGDMTAMAEAVLALAADRNAVAKLGRQARADAVKFLEELDYPERLRSYLAGMPLPWETPRAA